LSESLFSQYLYTAGMPDPEVIIRTSGEVRLSNFLMWQAAYAELVVLDLPWPEFTEEKLIEALKSFSGRERRFGKTGQQIQKKK
jgi:undecaprenyl diphosphate synthase